MKLDPGIHIVMHSVLFLKSGVIVILKEKQDDQNSKDAVPLRRPFRPVSQTGPSRGTILEFSKGTSQELIKAATSNTLSCSISEK